MRKIINLDSGHTNHIYDSTVEESWLPMSVSDLDPLKKYVFFFFKVFLFIIAVKKKHAEAVPHLVSESEFWTRFFQSHYFHRDRHALPSKDIFTECAKIDEEGM